VGKVAPLYVGSAGKLLLSELGQRELQVILKNLKMEPVGPNTITDKQTLLAELEKVRRLGYAVSMGERLAHSASISVSIKNYICPVSLSILGPEGRFRPHLMDALPAMQEEAADISQKLLAYQEQDS
jgi:DNA-binding IclR family transcriptional regulator